MWFNCLRNDKLMCFIGGVVTATIGVKILKSDKTRGACVRGLAKGMKLQRDAQEIFQNMKEDASDICFDARKEADSADSEE